MLSRICPLDAPPPPPPPPSPPALVTNAVNLAAVSAGEYEVAESASASSSKEISVDCRAAVNPWIVDDEGGGGGAEETQEGDEDRSMMEGEE